MRRALAWLGRQARWALPIGVFTGIVLPDLAAILRPVLTPAVIGTLAAALLRLDGSALRRTLTRPGRLAALAGFQLVVSPLLVWFACTRLGVPAPLAVSLVLQAAAPPIGSAAVFALILGLDGALTMAASVIGTLLLPLSLTAVVALLLPHAGVRVDLGAFFARVSLLVAAPFAIAGVLRVMIGANRLARHDDLLGGLNVVLLLVFAIAVMDGVTARLLREPGLILTLMGMAALMAVILHAIGYWVFARLDRGVGFVAALVGGNRNMGLMLAVTAGTAGDVFSLYVGIAQIPMYFAPLLLMPLVRRRLARACQRDGDTRHDPTP